ncbi:MAG: nitroreductase family deazaflavin-dependent oxidoreductase [Halioglobus sp.]
MGLLQTNLVKNALSQPRVIAFLKRVVPPLDKFLLRISRGWINTAMQSVALIETTGAKSGQRRSIATLCMPEGRDLVLVGSNWGQEKDPAWAHNLRANPNPKVHFRGYVGPAHASELSAHERALTWQKLIEFNPQYAQYQQGTQRTLPIFVLSRTG